MRYRMLTWVSLAALMFGASQAHAQWRSDRMPADAAPNAKRLIVTYQDGPDSAAAKAANAKVGSIFIRPTGSGDSAVITLPPNADVNQSMATLRAQPGVTHVELDGLKTVSPLRGPTLEH
ncbi:S8 family serine peptidase [Dyella sp.]|uniref:S8 family serine peptidase n=1 Tax=Dyella sp. TaxID=1869338 RepID=UPI002ED44765